MAYNILIVDDSRLARMAVSRMLIALRPDWPQVEAGSAAEALDVASRTAIDLAILDFNMPDRDGLHLAADLRALFPDMPIVMISANNQKEVLARAAELGATFIVKPIREEALKAFLDDAAERLSRNI